VWLSAWFLKALSDDLHDEVFQEHSKLPPLQQGAASLIKLALDKIQKNSHEARHALQSIITSFSLSTIPNEDVKVAVMHLKAVISALDNTHDLPTKSLTYILDGMSNTSSSPELNTLCTML
jgi:restriction endonuclease